MTGDTCTTCGAEYSKTAVSYCSSSFHCCRDCKWEDGVRVMICKFCHERDVKIAVEWDRAARSQTSTVPDMTKDGNTKELEEALEEIHTAAAIVLSSDRFVHLNTLHQCELQSIPRLVHDAGCAARALVAELATMRSQLEGMTGERDDERLISKEWEVKCDNLVAAMEQRDRRSAAMTDALQSIRRHMEPLNSVIATACIATVDAALAAPASPATATKENQWRTEPCAKCGKDEHRHVMGRPNLPNHSYDPIPPAPVSLDTHKEKP